MAVVARPPFFAKPRPLGLAAHASIYVVGLSLCMAVVCVATMIAGFNAVTTQDSRRLGMNSIAQASNLIARRLAQGDGPALSRAASSMASPHDIAEVAIYDADCRLLARGGLAAAAARDGAVRAVCDGAPAAHAVAGDIVWSIARIEHEGRRVGAMSVAVSRARVAAGAFERIQPLFLFFVAFMALAIPLTVLVVRRRAQPLAQLTAFAERVTQDGLGGQVDIKTGDEFERLADAFNQMMTRLDASMKRVQRLAFVDSATNLPNGEHFTRALTTLLTRPRAPESCAAVLIVDLDRLRRLLETLGEAAAQDLVTHVAERMRQSLRAVDRVVRMGAAKDSPALLACLRPHEFAVLADAFAGEEDVARFAQLLAASINQPFDWRDLKLTLDCCVGAAIAHRDGHDADALTRHARLAVSAARTHNKGARVFTSAMDREAKTRLALEQEMRAALERGEFNAFFQPKINMATGRIEGAEALARWVRPDRTIVGPAQFIPAAEESGLIGQVADLVMREACWKAAAWAREGLPIQVAVNVSPLQFKDERFPEHVIRILENAGLPAFCLELEITEGIAVEDPERALRMIEPLRQRGVRFAIDDFGCGHSSLAALTRLPFDVLKIDRQFIAGLEKDRHAAAIIETILAMAATLDMQVVAEGIEREQDAEFLRRRGCRYAQGYLYGAAEPAAQFAERLRAQRTSVLAREEGAPARQRLSA